MIRNVNNVNMINAGKIVVNRFCPSCCPSSLKSNVNANVRPSPRRSEVGRKLISREGLVSMIDVTVSRRFSGAGIFCPALGCEIGDERVDEAATTAVDPIVDLSCDKKAASCETDSSSRLSGDSSVSFALRRAWRLARSNDCRLFVKIRLYAASSFGIKNQRNRSTESTSLNVRASKSLTNFDNRRYYSNGRIIVPVKSEMGVFRFSDYDCVGFDLDNTLLRYNVTNMVELEYECLARFAVEKRGHDSKYLYEKLGKRDFDFMQKGLLVDFERGNILRLSADGSIVRASHGTELLNDEQLYAVYPNGRWQITDDFTSDPLVTWNGPLSEKIRALLDYFDMPASLIFAKIIDTIDENRRVESYDAVKDYSVWTDVLDGLVDMFDREHFANGRGRYFSTLKGNPDKYLHRSSDKLIAWLKDLKKTKLTYLVTGSNADFANFTASYALGEDWKSLFDVVVCYAKKPGFFTGSRPFLKVNNDHTDGEIVAGSELKRGGIYSQGNWKEIEEFFARTTGKESPSCLYVGDNLIQDIYTPNRYVNCDTVAVVEEQLAEGMSGHSLSHGDEHLLNSDVWGSYFHVDSGEKSSPSIWSHFINSYSKICIPSVEFIVGKSLDTPIKSFGNEGDKKLSGYYPAKPRSIAGLL